MRSAVIQIIFNWMKLVVGLPGSASGALHAGSQNLSKVLADCDELAPPSRLQLVMPSRQILNEKSVLVPRFETFAPLRNVAVSCPRGMG